MRTDLVQALAERGLLFQQTEGLAEHLAGDARVGYCGFDPTAPSLHIGNLVPVMGLVHLARAGHRAVALVGGGTALIGDPSGKSSERPLITAAEVDANGARIGAQLEKVFAAAGVGVTMADNAVWLRSTGAIDFMRDVGKHFSINWMMQKDSVKSRLEAGISYTEFSYMLLQAFDFLELKRRHGVTLQLGGSDQWGNITAGTELVRRAGAGEAFGLTLPLVTTSSGKKFGKTESGAVWLDPERTTPYAFYQFWVNTEDADVIAYLRMFTLLDVPAIDALAAEVLAAPQARAAQQALAREVTTLIHGADAARVAAEVSRVVFDRRAEPAALDDSAWRALAAEIPAVDATFTSEGALDVVDALAAAFALSKGAARKLIQQGGVALNGAKLDAEATSAPIGTAVRGRWWLLRKGARDVAVVRGGGNP
ncbi:MAG: tyrosine--tRNA ligase [Gemmatimonadaceae bacterium]|nr:tyrosine--tRNA ligase [Gemmatimonadaceae bacterium]